MYYYVSQAKVIILNKIGKVKRSYILKKTNKTINYFQIIALFLIYLKYPFFLHYNKN